MQHNSKNYVSVEFYIVSARQKPWISKNTTFQEMTFLNKRCIVNVDIVDLYMDRHFLPKSSSKELQVFWPAHFWEFQTYVFCLSLYTS